MQSQLIERPDDLTDEWLTGVLGTGRVTGHDVERIGTGQMSECYRVALRYADGDSGPASVVLKVAAADPSSRTTGLAMGLYEREVRFYAEVAPGVSAGEHAPFAPCFHHAYDAETGAFDLVLGDAAPATVGDEIRGATAQQAALALHQLGLVHGPLLGNPELAGAAWLNRDAPINQALIAGLYAAFAERYADRIDPRHRAVCERLVGAFDDYLAQEAGATAGLVHGDYRLDNMLFGQPGADRPLTVVDWQTVTWGPACTDVAYFLGCALAPEVRREHYEDLLATYHGALGTGAPTLGEVRDGVRRQSFFGVMMAIVSSMLVERTDRGDAMFMTMLHRHCEHVLDIDALAVLPEAAAPEPLTPDAEDEGPHQPTDEPLWSESWYFDFTDDAQGIGGWVRLGLIPNQGTAWVNALVCGPGMPTVALNDFEVTLPADPGRLRTDALDLSLTAIDPLRSYRVTVRGRGEAFDDPAGLLHGGTGRPADLTLDLEFTTAGTPYQYRITPRYEIPCTVSGTATVAGHEYTLSAVPGQRDHSWGVRDWWSMDWVWSALHLEDGTHLHGVDIRIPGIPPVGIGYLQKGDEFVELQSVSAEKAFGDNGLPVSTSIALAPGDVSVSVEVKGHAPVLLTSPDGKVSHFPRAWVSVTADDGRRGTGWVEWNRNL
ncbi:MAG: phosphotransferase [Mycobacterium sp.]